jgi:hypothetical protein
LKYEFREPSRAIGGDQARLGGKLTNLRVLAETKIGWSWQGSLSATKSPPAIARGRPR